MGKFLNGTTWVALASAAAAIAACSDPGMPTSVKMWAAIVAGCLNSLHVAGSKAADMHANQMAVAAKALAVQGKAADVALAQTQLQHAAMMAGLVADPAAAEKEPDAGPPEAAPIVVNSNPAPTPATPAV